ncbi:hypothetical protein [Streptomyces sp. ISL-86]|uniref:hypothetical protein n=1 Tax=Streptomyces sp. ISL-86 TaxID=2819187 RepID=UPI001BEC3F04|nr:hypothetical protein [Streptomyces sp. ISL-86]MBT2457619.1 hypothetical protein [Streptomyces sp. ISL-86]
MTTTGDHDLPPRQLRRARQSIAVPAKVEALRSEAKRLVARGWLDEPAPGRFMLAKAAAARGGRS